MSSSGGYCIGDDEVGTLRVREIEGTLMLRPKGGALDAALDTAWTGWGGEPVEPVSPPVLSETPGGVGSIWLLRGKLQKQEQN